MAFVAKCWFVEPLRLLFPSIRSDSILSLLYNTYAVGI